MHDERLTVLVVEDDADVGPIIVRQLRQAKIDATLVTGARAALREVEAASFHCVLSDIRMDGMDGMELLAELKKRDPALPVVMLTAFPATSLAVRAMRLGASDFLEKPYRGEDLVAAVAKSASLAARAQATPPETPRFGDIVGRSPAIESCLERVERAAKTRGEVLVTGESGTGKELVARAIHALSPRRDKPFVAVNTAAINPEFFDSEIFGHLKHAFTTAFSERPGKVKLAEGGTLFLDEIGDLPLQTQVKLLRLLQEGEYEPLGATRTSKADIRVVAATHRDIKKMVKEGTFREDLYYRLNVLPVKLPPLRERGSDIPLLAEHFLHEVASDNGRRAMRFTPDALEALSRHAYPGNVRELFTVIRRLVVFCDEDVIHPSDVLRELDSDVLDDSRPDDIAEARRRAEQDVRRTYVLKALGMANGNKKAAAELLGIARRTLFNWMDELGLRTPGDVDGDDDEMSTETRS